MKVLSIQEPFATMIMNHDKVIETRSWKTTYRGRLYIHASSSKKIPNYCDYEIIKEYSDHHTMHYGEIICSCTLVDCVLMDKDFIRKIKNNSKEYSYGLYEEGRYAWILENIEVIDPISIRGHLGLWNYDKID